MTASVLLARRLLLFQFCAGLAWLTVFLKAGTICSRRSCWYVSRSRDSSSSSHTAKFPADIINRTCLVDPMLATGGSLNCYSVPAWGWRQAIFAAWPLLLPWGAGRQILTFNCGCTPYTCNSLTVIESKCLHSPRPLAMQATVFTIK